LSPKHCCPCQLSIDRIGPLFRAEALAAINDALKITEDAFDDFDELLMEFAKSPLLADEETERAPAKERAIEAIASTRSYIRSVARKAFQKEGTNPSQALPIALRFRSHVSCASALCRTLNIAAASLLIKQSIHPAKPARSAAARARMSAFAFQN